MWISKSMKYLVCSIVGIFLLYTLYLIPFTPVFAAEDFSTSYDVSYDVSADSTTLVTQKVQLKNLTSQYYVENFTLTIGSTTLSDVTASDEKGPMETKVSLQDQKTSITVKFNSQVAGVGKTQNFTLRFRSKDFAQRLGKVWEVDLPKIPTSTNITSYKLSLLVPKSFGDPTSLSPAPILRSGTLDKQIYEFSKESLEKSGVSVSFGTSQLFDFNISYPLENKSLFPVMTSITLPPDTSYQDIFINEIDPAPDNVTVDGDGNYLAWYRLPRGYSQTIRVSGQAKLLIEPKQKASSLSPSQIASYTKADKYWETQSPSIVNLSQEILKGMEGRPVKERAQLLYRYVVNNLSYSTKRLSDNNIERFGAVTALNNTESAVCMEFTDLFIALARASGIPTRELDGFAYSQNPSLRPLSLSKDLLHTWPEYFDPERGWVMVDPTWENTSGGVDYFNKFDLSHLVLSIKGHSSQTPYISDDVKVTLSSEEIGKKDSLEVIINSPEYLWAGLPGRLTVEIINKGNTTSLPQTLNLTSSDINVLKGLDIKTERIPPFGRQTFHFDLRTPLIWEERPSDLTVKIGEKVVMKNVLIRPFILFKYYPYVIAALAAIGLGIYLGIFVLHRRQSKKR